MMVLVVRDADAYERLWTDLEGREEVLEELGGDANPVRLLMTWLCDYDTTPLCVPVYDADVISEIQAAIESMQATFDEGSEGIELTEMSA
jgi:hypothetical protein